MIARDVIKEVMRLVGDFDGEDILNKIDENSSLDANETKCLNRYISGLNIAVDTIASKYYTTTKEVFVTSDSEKRVEYTALDERVCDIISVRDLSNLNVEFYSLPFSLFLPKKHTRYLVKFKFLPKKVTNLTDEVEILPFVPLLSISYLMASDIFLAKNLYDESRFWFSKFESSISSAVASRRMRTLNVNRLI